MDDERRYTRYKCDYKLRNDFSAILQSVCVCAEMDQEALNYTREHYNKHSNKHADQASALRARAQGPSMPLKKFHNSIKRLLINRFAHGTDRLLDLACGRGGDLWKWIDANIGYVKGVDLSPGEIEEARGRYRQAVEKRGAAGVGTVVEFMDSSVLGIEEFREEELYDAVTCMFALHYFFVSQKALKQFLHNVAINLKPGGYFFGTVPDGKSINQCVMKSPKFKSPMLTVEARWKGMPQPFGSPYICAIGDTVTGGEEGTEGSLEYLVYQSVLVGVAKEVGLEPVLDYQDPELEQCLQPADAGRVLKHFAPRFPSSDPSLEVASALFCTFVFKKTDDTKKRKHEETET
jgi:2-polyprenyl-3-methyl-5-hydroxy-6-metoxy-1,4-benzoquinol methylase